MRCEGASCYLVSSPVCSPLPVPSLTGLLSPMGFVSGSFISLLSYSCIIRSGSYSRSISPLVRQHQFRASKHRSNRFCGVGARRCNLLTSSFPPERTVTSAFQPFIARLRPYRADCKSRQTQPSCLHHQRLQKSSAALHTRILALALPYHSVVTRISQSLVEMLPLKRRCSIITNPAPRIPAMNSSSCSRSSPRQGLPCRRLLDPLLAWRC